ncbi:MAG: DUF1365 domain-containing protein [Granulosicoccus sp.]
MSLRSSLYVGQVYHKRMRPKVHVLKYTVFSVLIDLSEIDTITRKFWLFSHNRFNLFSFHDSDFGESSKETLTDYLHRQLSQAGIHTMPVRTLLSCYPRVLGYSFNPLSLFYCLDENDRCYAVVHEVHNTFGERHAYVLPVSSDESEACEWIHQHASKSLFVSPFAHMDMHYEFRLNHPAEKQVVVIRASDEKGLVITASYIALRQVLSTSQLLKVFLRIPLLGAKVITGIHWEAFKLWVKGIPLFKHQPKKRTT